MSSAADKLCFSSTSGARHAAKKCKPRRSPNSKVHQDGASNSDSGDAAEAASDAPDWPRSADPSLQRGWCALQRLAAIDLPLTVASSLPRHLDVIAAAVRDCYCSRTRPTLPAIQARLSRWGIAEEVQRSVLPAAARDPSRFMFSLPVDCNISVLLANKHHEGVFEETPLDHSTYTDSFLEALMERYYRTAGTRLIKSREGAVSMCLVPVTYAVAQPYPAASSLPCLLFPGPWPAREEVQKETQGQQPCGATVG